MKTEKESKIEITVGLDNNNVPTSIEWNASQANINEKQKAKALLLSLWEEDQASALRIDLWTDKMRIDEMADFYFQVFLGLAKTFEQSTKNNELSNDIKNFAQDFIYKFNNQNK